MNAQASMRDDAAALARRLGCTECDAVAVTAAARANDQIEALETAIGTWQEREAEGQRPAALTTVVTDDAGDYVLESERCKASRRWNGMRPSRITFLISAVAADGTPAALAIPATAAFGNDDTAIGHPELVSLLLARGPVYVDDVRRMIRTAVLGTGEGNGAGARRTEAESFDGAAELEIERALVGGRDAGVLDVTMKTTMVVGDGRSTVATAEAGAGAAWPEHRGSGVGIEEDWKTAVATAGAAAMDALMEKTGRTRERAARIQRHR